MPKAKRKVKSNQAFIASVIGLAVIVGLLMVRGSATGTFGGKAMESKDYGTLYAAHGINNVDETSSYSLDNACRKASASDGCVISSDNMAISCSSRRSDGTTDIFTMNIPPGSADPAFANVDVDSALLGPPISATSAEVIINYCESNGADIPELGTAVAKGGRP